MMENGFNSRRSAALVSIQKVSLLAKSVIVVAGLICSGFAHASAETYTFRTSGGQWWNDAGNPYGLSYSPSLYGSITIDPSILDAQNFMSITGFSLVTGTKTWTLADLDHAYASSNKGFITTSVSSTRNETSSTQTITKTAYFSLHFRDSLLTDNRYNKMIVDTGSSGGGGTFLIQDGGLKDNACNNCLYTNKIITTKTYIFPTSPVPEPEAYGMMLVGLGLIGFIARRRKNEQA